MSISLRIKELRTKKNISQKDFSALIGVDNSQFSKIEQGKLQPTLTQIMEISSKFEVSLDWICFGKIVVNSDLDPAKFELQNKLITMQEKEINRLEVENSELKTKLDIASKDGNRRAG
ncbi:helix-turn-helix domain-containing protein [Flavobacterium covae]|uniref:helix-turn-helix domain-containing protein n=1 Tax=Flavobacterium covae TaxID=2906076 RepID=UPI000745BE75|nr:helix-turn-helix transcriptional regulator [Flavobacterium covae]AMA48956.1 hypothetical protein AWN65_05505 [Flavobacterium covae]MCJ1810148.1 helix-turn-helix domain-containing protein [Flavobacterium covae]